VTGSSAAPAVAGELSTPRPDRTSACQDLHTDRVTMPAMSKRVLAALVIGWLLGIATAFAIPSLVYQRQSIVREVTARSLGHGCFDPQPVVVSTSAKPQPVVCRTTRDPDS
jgi:hypothetical protein